MKIRSPRGGLTVICLAICLVAVGVLPVRADKVVMSSRSQSLGAGHVAILGQVARSGVYELPQGGLTLSGLVQLTGGLGAEASGNVRVIRRGRGGFQTFYSPQVRYDLMDGDILVFDRRQHTLSAGLRNPDGMAGLQTRAAAPSHVTIAVANLAAHPVVIDLTPESATLHGLLQQLRQPLTPDASVMVITPGRGQEIIRLSSGGIASPFVTGTVVVVDHSTVIAQNLPKLPNVIRPQDAASRTTSTGTAPRFVVTRGAVAGPAAPQPRRSVTTVWAGELNPTRASTGAREPSPPEQANAGPTNSGQVNSPALNPGLFAPPPVNPPMMSAPGSTSQSPSGLPSPSQPLLEAPPSEGRGTENVAPLGFPAQGIGPSVAKEPMPLIPIIERGDSEAPVPDPRAVPLPDEEPALTGSPSKSRRLDLAAAIAAGMCTLVGLAIWLQRRMNARVAVEETTAAQTAGTATGQATASAGAAPAIASRPAVSTARAPSPEKPARAKPAVGSHPVPRPHFAPAPTTPPSRVPRNAAAYDVIMPPEPAPPARKTQPQANAPVAKGGPEAQGTNGLLDRVLASVQNSRLR